VDADRIRLDDLVSGLREEGLAIRDRFLGEPQVRALALCAAARQERGDFAPARIGAGGALQWRADLRGDWICWLEQPLFPAERELLEQLEEMRRCLNQHLFLGLYELELQYARYPRGAGYARHIDQPHGRAARRLSWIVYLNETWSAADGGTLRCFNDQGVLREIEPLSGRLAIFLTEGRQHEVLPAVRERLSIAGWFLVREEHALR
jgi:SM-20-related protein